MRITYSKSFLLFAATLLLTSGNQALAASPDTHPAKSWLDQAESAKQCPATPVNVPASDKESSASLLKRVFISGDKLYIKGTDDPDHIVVSSGGSSRFVDVAWNGKQLGRFGPVKKIELRGHGGDDVLIVKSSVTLPVLIDGGSGDDCIQGGSGADQLFGSFGDDVLIAGTGRPALDSGSGNDRIVVPHPMGTLSYAPGADSGVLRALGQIYDLKPLGKAPGSSKGTPSPVILGLADLGDEQILSQLQAIRAAGQAIVLTNVTSTQSEQFRLVLGHPNSANATAGSKSSSTSSAPSALTFFRTAPRPGTHASDYSTGNFDSLSGPLNDGLVQWLSRVFSATAIVPQAPADSPSNDLQTLANSYTSSAVFGPANGPNARLSNSVWDVRSFQNKSDFYYVRQTLEAFLPSPQLFLSTALENLVSSFSATPGLVQTSPASTTCSESTTSSVGWNAGGSAGWSGQQGPNAVLTGGVSVSNSETVSCPNTKIVNDSNPGTGRTVWLTLMNNAGQGIQTYVNQWIWQVPFKAYNTDFTKGDASLLFQSLFANLGGLGSLVPLPLGNTFTLQKPAVSSVSPTCVPGGDIFDINGTGLYPSLVTSVLIGGTALSTSNYSFASTTDGTNDISVVAPHQPALSPQSVIVQTSEGTSNADVSIEIPYLYCSDSGAGKK